MSSFQSFEEIRAWQEAEKLCLGIYSEFKFCKDFGFKDQIQRAAISVMNNISEGYERNGNKEFRNFLFIAKGSVAEVRSMLTIAPKLDYIPAENAEELIAKSNVIAKQLSALIKTLAAQPYKP